MVGERTAGEMALVRPGRRESVPGSVEMADECLGMRGVPGTEKSKHEGRRAPGTPGGAGSRPVWGWSRVNVGSWEGSWEVRAEVGRETAQDGAGHCKDLGFYTE